MKEISIVIPVYNVKKIYLEECMKSIIAQGMNDMLEVILVDDGSTNDSMEVVTQYQKENDFISIYRQKNMGAPAARNKGLELSHGRYILFFDCDDILFPNALMNLIERAYDTDADLVIGDYEKFDGEFIIKQNYDRSFDKLENLLFRQKEILEMSELNAFPGNKLFKREYLEKNNISFTSLRIAQDLFFFLNFIAYDPKVAFVSDKIFYYRIHEGSISKTMDKRILDIVKCFNKVEKIYKEIGTNKEALFLVKQWKLHHFVAQMRKVPLFQEKKERYHIVNTLRKELKVSFVDAMNFRSASEKKNFFIFKIKELLKVIYCSDAYAKYYCKKWKQRQVGTIKIEI